jgi:SAM-dependent methyltransferase
MIQRRHLRRSDGRIVFGTDPGRYDRARPPYPPFVFTTLVDRCGLERGTAVLEIGAGTGKATAPVLELGADPLVAVEPNAALAAYLAERTAAAPARVDIRVEPFETVEVPSASFDLAMAATSFHWIDPDVGLAKVARSLRPGGWWAAWWNLYGDPDRDDPFHLATQDLLAAVPPSISDAPERPWYALDAERRSAELEAAGFEAPRQEVVRWVATFTTEAIVELYSTFSTLAVVDADERDHILAGLAATAEEFGGRVERPGATVMYTARLA